MCIKSSLELCSPAAPTRTGGGSGVLAAGWAWRVCSHRSPDRTAAPQPWDTRLAARAGLLSVCPGHATAHTTHRSRTGFFNLLKCKMLSNANFQITSEPQPPLHFPNAPQASRLPALCQGPCRPPALSAAGLKRCQFQGGKRRGSGAALGPSGTRALRPADSTAGRGRGARQRPGSHPAPPRRLRLNRALPSAPFRTVPEIIHCSLHGRAANCAALQPSDQTLRTRPQRVVGPCQHLCAHGKTRRRQLPLNRYL